MVVATGFEPRRCLRVVTPGRHSNIYGITSHTAQPHRLLFRSTSMHAVDDHDECLVGSGVAGVQERQGAHALTPWHPFAK